MAGYIEGKDGFLFLADDSNRLHDQLTGHFHLPAQTLDEIADRHRERQAIAIRAGAVYRHVVVPEKEVVLHHLLPEELRARLVLSQRPMRQYLDRFPAPAGLFYDDGYMRAIAPRGLIYARQDTHWTYLGANQYFNRMLHALGLPGEYDAYRSLTFRRTGHVSVGDLGVIAGRPPEILPTISIAGSRARILLDNGVENVGRVRLSRNPAAPLPRRVLVFHDSVANWLVWALGGLYREALMIHHPDVDGALIRNFAPDILYFFQIERFFVRPPRNDVDLPADIARLEADKGATVSAARPLAAMRSRSVWRAHAEAWLRRRLRR